MRHSAMRNSRYCCALVSVISIRHQMETFSTWLALCAGNSPVTGEFPSQRPVKRSFDYFIALCLNKRLSKQSRRRWFERLSRSLWRHCNDFVMLTIPWLIYGTCRMHHMGSFRCVIHIHWTIHLFNTLRPKPLKYPSFRRWHFQTRFLQWACRAYFRFAPSQWETSLHA